MATEVYIVFVMDDIEPSVSGPYENEDVRDKAARTMRREQGPEHGIFALDIADGKPEIWSYGAGALDEEEEGG